MSRYNDRQRRTWRKFSSAFSGILAGQTPLRTTDRAEFLVGLDFSAMKQQIGKRRGRCRLGWFLLDLGGRQRLPSRITQNDVRDAVATVRARQFRNGRSGARIGYRDVGISAIQVAGLFEGTKERSTRVTIINDGKEQSSAAFRSNMQKLAQDLACALAQKVIITSLDKTPPSWLHSPTGYPNP